MFYWFFNYQSTQSIIKIIKHLEKINQTTGWNSLVKQKENELKHSTRYWVTPKNGIKALIKLKIEFELTSQTMRLLIRMKA